ncbi:MAG: pimeloyl-ACP methyl ester esterase BioH [Methylococcaceae bacterium]
MTKNLHIEIFGQGKTIVLLHGWAMHAGVLRNFAMKLAQQARVICVDLPGHGRSPLQQPFELQAIAAELIQALDEAPCCWLGWSLGALVALEVARQAPEKVSSVVLLAGSPCFVKKAAWPGLDITLLDTFANSLLRNPKATAARFMALQIHGMPQEKHLLQALKSSLVECAVPDTNTLQAGLRVLKNQDLRAVVATLSCPVLALLGAKDVLVPIAIAPHLQALRPSVQVAILADAGHVPFLSHPAETAQRVIDFIQAV